MSRATVRRIKLPLLVGKKLVGEIADGGRGCVANSPRCAPAVRSSTCSHYRASALPLTKPEPGSERVLRLHAVPTSRSGGGRRESFACNRPKSGNLLTGWMGFADAVVVLELG